MNLSIIVAKSENNVIGNNNSLPWHIPEDLKNFRSITMGHPILMGRKTFESIGRPLPGRANLVITRNPLFSHHGVSIYTTIEDAIKAHQDAGEVFVIGGEECYRQTLPIASRLYVTQIHSNVEGDTYFPDIKKNEWNQIERVTFPATESRILGFSFLILDRLS